jgi:hypothetical protein
MAEIPFRFLADGVAICSSGTSKPAYRSNQIHIDLQRRTRCYLEEEAHGTPRRFLRAILLQGYAESLELWEVEHNLTVPS